MTPLISSDGSRTAKHFQRGTHRTRSPVETVAGLQPFLGRFGITRVADVTGMDCVGIDTVMVVRPNARSVSVSQGKGADLAAAKASGLMESIEQFHAEHILLPLRLANRREIAGLGAVADVERLPQFVREFDASRRILWISGTDLMSGESISVPYESVHLDLRLPLPEGSGFFLSGSNGLASGNHPLEAVSHGLCELIERDALSLFFQESADGQRARRVDPSSVDDPVCIELLDKYRSAEISVGVWDITSDVGVACFLCWIVEANDDSFRPVGLAQGSGCHPVRSIALARALCEAAQSRITRIVGSRDDMQKQDLDELRDRATLALHRSQIASQPETRRSFTLAPSHATETLEEDLELLLNGLRRARVSQVIVVDLSHPTLPVHVVRVIVPGLEAPSYLPGYRPGQRALAHPARQRERTPS